MGSIDGPCSVQRVQSYFWQTWGRGEESAKRRGSPPCRTLPYSFRLCERGLLDPISETEREFLFFVYGGLWTLFILWERGREKGEKNVFYFLVCLEKASKEAFKEIQEFGLCHPLQWFSFGALRGHATNQHVVPTSLCYNLKWKLFPNWKQDLFLARAFCFTPKISRLPQDIFHTSSHLFSTHRFQTFWECLQGSAVVTLLKRFA